MNWRTHKGTALPCHEGCMVQVKYRNGHISKTEHRAGSLKWSDRGEPFDIAEYRVTQGPEA